METKTKKITRRGQAIALAACRCGQTPKLEQVERSIYIVKCRCGIEFFPEPMALSRRAVAEAWNKAGR